MADLPIRRGESPLSRVTREFDPFQRMRELMQWDPLAEMSRLMLGREPGGFVPAFEVKETKDAFVFKADLPGVQERDLDISVTGDRITISGKRESEGVDESSERFYAYERSYGSFTRAFTLPEGVDVDNVVADLKDGVLTLRLPKRPEVQPRRIQLGAEKKAKA